MAVLGTTLAGALAAEYSAGASAVRAQGRHPSRDEGPTLNVSTDMEAFGQPNMIFKGNPGDATVQASALLAANCTTLTLRNFSIDYDLLPFSQYVVQANPGGDTLTVTPQSGFNDLGVFASAISAQTPPPSGPTPPQLVWAFVFRGGTRLYNTSRLKVSAVNAMTGAVTLGGSLNPNALSLVEPGDVLVIAVRTGGAALKFETSVGLTLQNVSIYSSGIQGVFAAGASSSFISGVNVVPAPGTSRLVSANAGGVVLDQAGANNQIVDSTFIGVQDDSVAVNALTIGTIGP